MHIFRLYLESTINFWNVWGQIESQRGWGSAIWLCLLAVGLASLKINKLFDDKEPIDSLIPSLGLSHSLFSTALLPSPVSFFAPAYLEGWERRVSVLCVFGGEALTATLLHLLFLSAAGFFFHPVCSHPPCISLLRLIFPFIFHCHTRRYPSQSRLWRIKAAQHSRI